MSGAQNSAMPFRSPLFQVSMYRRTSALLSSVATCRLLAHSGTGPPRRAVVSFLRIVSDRPAQVLLPACLSLPGSATSKKPAVIYRSRLAIREEGGPVMPMQDEQRRAYLQRAGVSQQQIDQTVGDLPIHEGS